MIREYNERGVTIFLTTHDLEVANELCDRIAIINHGKLISLDTPYNLKKLTQENQTIDIQFESEVEKSIIEKLQSAKEIKKVNGGFHIIVEDNHVAICELVDLVKSNNLTLRQLNTNQPKLEEAFLKIIEEGVKNE